MTGSPAGTGARWQWRSNGRTVIERKFVAFSRVQHLSRRIPKYARIAPKALLSNRNHPRIRSVVQLSVLKPGLETVLQTQPTSSVEKGDRRITGLPARWRTPRRAAHVGATTRDSRGRGKVLANLKAG